MKIVIDTSVVISVITNESHKEKLIKITEGRTLIAPESLQFEIGNAFSAMFRRNRITLDDALRAIEIYLTIPIQYFPVDILRAINIAEQFKIYAYDAYFIECAARNRSPILSIDEGLIEAAGNYGVHLVEV